jgi:hypothetical protein
MLNDFLVDMDNKISIKYLGQTIFQGIVMRSSQVILRSIEEYVDPESVYFGEIPVSLELRK